MWMFTQFWLQSRLYRSREKASVRLLNLSISTCLLISSLWELIRSFTKLRAWQKTLEDFYMDTSWEWMPWVKMRMNMREEKSSQNLPILSEHIILFTHGISGMLAISVIWLANVSRSTRNSKRLGKINKSCGRGFGNSRSTWTTRLIQTNQAMRKGVNWTRVWHYRRA